MTGLFVTATDTGVGKTTVTCVLAGALRRRGRRVAVMKPFETGDSDDAERLKMAAGDPRPLAAIRPHRLALPSAPMVAAEAEGRALDLSQVIASYSAITADIVLVEGAGGLLVPINRTTSMADVAVVLNIPILIVARPSLGTINHTLLTIEAARRRGIDILGVVFSASTPSTGPEESRTPSLIAELGQTRVWGTLPYSTATAEADLAALIDALD